MIRVTTSVIINRTSDEVFAYISNFENNPQWQAGQISCRFSSDGPLGVGSTYDQVAKFLGRKIISTFEVLEYVPDKMVKASTTSGSFPITFTRMVKPGEGDSTEVTAVIEGDSTGFFKLAEPLMARMVKRSVDTDYRNLKRILEGDEAV